jgi:preprotein translocase subunit SecB
MAKENSNSGKSADSKAPYFNLERIYVKDLSFETPLGAESFSTKWEPEVDLDLNNKASIIKDDFYEVVLSLTVTAKQKGGGSAYYLVEVQQAGLFRVGNFSEEERKRVLATAAPATLFPYVRETIDSILLKAGFPPLMLAPVNFEALLQAAMQKKMQEQQEGGKPTLQ